MTENPQKTILFVDDKPSSHAFYRKRLVDNYRIKLAFNLKEAIDALKSDKIALAVIDLYLPGEIPIDLSLDVQVFVA